MNERPLRVVETVVAFLTPIACREHVLGDLRERNESLLGYALDATRVIPYTIWSRVLRTTPARLLLLQAAAIAASFVASTIAAGPDYFRGPVSLVRLAVPVVAGLLGLVLADAYRDDAGPWDARRQAIRRIRPVKWAFMAVGLTQLVLFFARPAWFLPPQVILPASVLIFLLLMAVRASVVQGPASYPLAQARNASPTAVDATNSVAPQDVTRRIYRLLLVFGVLGAGPVYFFNGAGRLPWLAMSLVSFYSAFRVRRLPEHVADSEAERLAMARGLFLRWASAPMVCTLIATVLLNPLRHPDQPELLLRTVPVLALSLAWYWSARTRSRESA